MDPVGAGATHYRTDTAQHLLEIGQVSVLRGNASEIGAVLAGIGGTKGVDSVHRPEEVVELAKKASHDRDLVVAISGETDFIVYKEEIAMIHNGTPLMTKVTAMGCTATSLIGAFLAVNPSPFCAAVHAMTVMGICGELAAERGGGKGPGSFRTSFVDALAGFGSAETKQIRVSLA